MVRESTDNDVIPPRPAPDFPPRTSNERDMLMSFLDRFRTVLVRKCAGVSSEDLQISVAQSSLTLGRLLRHMAFVEDYWFQHVLLGSELPALWATADWATQPDWEMDTAADFSGPDLAAQLDAATSRSRDAADGIDLDQLAVRAFKGGETSLRWIVIHMIAEYARHCGHADMIREAIDGGVGD